MEKDSSFKVWLEPVSKPTQGVLQSMQKGTSSGGNGTEKTQGYSTPQGKS